MSAGPATNRSEWTLGRLLSWTSEYLAGRKVEEARLASEVLLAHAAGCRRIDLYVRFDEVLPTDQLDRFRTSVRRAAAHEPIAYLIGEKEFFSLSMLVTPDVLIPRPETETLVECVIDHCREADLKEPLLIDLGTGSGCIAVAVLTQLEGARVVATDLSAAALAVAQKNAERHGVRERLTLAQADRLALPAETLPEGGFDVLMSNPPYVTPEAADCLGATVRAYEPRAALTDEVDGLSFFRAIAAEGPGLLGAGGCVVVEVGDEQAPAVLETMVAMGRLEHEATLKDRTVGHDRVLKFLLS